MNDATVPLRVSEAPEPPGGFKAESEAKLWNILWAAGYDLPPPEPIPCSPGDTFRMATVLRGPFARGPGVSSMVAVGKRAGPWAACELGIDRANPVNYFGAVRLCDLEFWSSVKSIGPAGTIDRDPADTPPVFDAEGNQIG